MGTGITSMLSSPEMYCKMLSIITYYNWIHFVLYYIAKKNTSIYPLTMVRGVIPENSIVKDKNTIIRKEIKNG